MALSKETPSAGDAEGQRGVQLCGQEQSENSLHYLRAQYLAEVFSLSPDSASTIAFLAFGEVAQ